MKARLKPRGVLRRIASLLLLAWVIGFLWFALLLPRPAGDTATDGVIALTGGPGRIARGLDVLRTGHARRLLIAGVDGQVTAAQFAGEYRVSPALLACCVTLGYESYDTRSNAHEAAGWIARQKLRSVRLVTTDWHMRRAAFDLKVAAPAHVTIIEDAVPSHPSMRALFVEYNKYLARIGAWLVNWPAPPRPAGAGHGGG